MEDIPESQVRSDSEFRYGWLVTSPSKSFAVYAETRAEKNDWLTHMQGCIGKLREVEEANFERAPTWVPDSEAKDCMRCLRVKFTALQRKHHCRKCGIVVCGGCSSNKMLLKEQSNKPLRVCDSCFESD